MSRKRAADCAVAAATLLIAACPSAAGAQERVHRGVAASATVSMRVFVPTGTVQIAVWNRDSIDITGTVGPTASVFGGGSREYAKFGVEPLRTGDTRLPEANWQVTVPAAARVWVKMTAGTIETDGTTGDIELYAVGGKITVRRATGVTSVESIDAAVVLSDCRGDIRLRGGKAPMLLQNVTGTASVTSVSGRVDIRGTSAPEGRIETIGGEISFDVLQLRGAALDLQTHSGAITLTVDRAAPPLLDLTSRTGAVQNPAANGSRAIGLITARSFRGAITVRLRGK